MYYSAPAISIDHGIKTISKYHYIHNDRTRLHAITQSTAHGKKESSVTVTSSTPNPVPLSCPEICNRCCRNYIGHTSLQKDGHCRDVPRNSMKETGQTSRELPKSPPTSRKLPFYAVYPN